MGKVEVPLETPGFTHEDAGAELVQDSGVPTPSPPWCCVLCPVVHRPLTAASSGPPACRQQKEDRG